MVLRTTFGRSRVNKNRNIDDIFSKTSEQSHHTLNVTSNATASNSTETSSQSHLPSMFIRDDVLKAELLWAIQTVTNHHTYRSTDGIADINASLLLGFVPSKILFCALAGK